MSLKEEQQQQSQVQVPTDENEDDDKKPFNPHAVTYADPLPQNWPLSSSDGSIEFKNVHFRYRPNLPLVLKGLSFKINKGEKIREEVTQVEGGSAARAQPLDFKMLEYFVALAFLL